MSQGNRLVERWIPLTLFDATELGGLQAYQFADISQRPFAVAPHLPKPPNLPRFPCHTVCEELYQFDVTMSTKSFPETVDSYYRDENTGFALLSCVDLREITYMVDPAMRLATWQRNIQKLVGDEHGRKIAIARAADMGPSQFGELISKPGKNPQIRQLERIAKALGVEVADLLRAEFTPQTGQPHAAVSASPGPVPFDPGDSARIERAVRAALGRILTDILHGISPDPDA